MVFEEIGIARSSAFKSESVPKYYMRADAWDVM